MSMIQKVGGSFSALFGTTISLYTKRGKHRPPLGIKKGQQLLGYDVEDMRFYRDFDMTHIKLKHRQSQTQIHQFDCQQQTNTCAFVFKTESIQKPSINLALDKMLQCGSKQYPVRNLSKQMCSHSFNSISSTIVTDDYIMFAFNSHAIKDYHNLFKVYFSMIFDPLMREEDFGEVIRRLQVGNGALKFQGELVGQLDQSLFQVNNTIYRLICQELIGKSSQSIVNPLELINLTFADVAQYYKQTITLSNCTLLLHGDMNIYNIIQQFESHIDKLKVKKYMPVLKEAQHVSVKYDRIVSFQHLKQQTILFISYKIENATEEENVLLEILSYLLYDMPESPFMRFNSPDTPYPNLYGFHDRYFNIGMSFRNSAFYHERGDLNQSHKFKLREKIWLQKQQQMLHLLNEIQKVNFDNKSIQKCLIHLQNNYYEKKGINIIQSIVNNIIQHKEVNLIFQVTSLISKIMKTYRKYNVFQCLLSKFIITNPKFIVFRGVNNPYMMQEQVRKNNSFLYQMQQNLSNEQMQKMSKYIPPNYLQDLSVLPQIKLNELQFLEDIKPEIEIIQNIKTYFMQSSNINKLTVKFDITDIGEDDIPLLPIFCQAFTQMGYKQITNEAYKTLLETFISKIDMNFETSKMGEGKMKIYLFLQIEFSDRNYENAFNVLNGLLSDFNMNNITVLSRVIHESASKCFNDVSENILHYHGMHLAASKTPYAFFKSPIFMARSTCSLAADMMKVTNPKDYLTSMKFRFEKIWNQMVQWERMEVLFLCKRDKRDLYKQYLRIMLAQVQQQGTRPYTISVLDFPTQKWMKYYPNYCQQISFQAFQVPYKSKQSPAALVLSSIINRNIGIFNKLGGCFLYKGALVAFIEGGRKKFIQLEDHYSNIYNLDFAKRNIFQHFQRYTGEHEFRTGVTFQQAKFFKQAVIATQKSQVEQVLHNYILSHVKAGTSSILALGPRLQNYEPLIKKGWEIQRSIDDVSLRMESLSNSQVLFKLQKYIDIC